MKVLERHSTDPADEMHATAFRARLGPIAQFVSGVNRNMQSEVSLLAVREGTKFDFVLKAADGKVAGVVQPIVQGGVVCGVHLQMTSGSHSSGNFALDEAGVALAAEMIEDVLELPPAAAMPR